MISSLRSPMPCQLGTFTCCQRVHGSVRISDKVGSRPTSLRGRPIVPGSLGGTGSAWAHANTAVVALAAKMARTVWALLRHERVYEPAAVAA